MQKVLNVSTKTDSFRCAIDGWGAEDGDEVAKAAKEYCSKYTYNTLPVGLIGPTCFKYTYQTVLHAIGDGWKLLAPPEKFSYNTREGKEITGYSWWLVKD